MSLPRDLNQLAFDPREQRPLGLDAVCKAHTILFSSASSFCISFSSLPFFRFFLLVFLIFLPFFTLGHAPQRLVHTVLSFFSVVFYLTHHSFIRSFVPLSFLLSFRVALRPLRFYRAYLSLPTTPVNCVAFVNRPLMYNLHQNLYRDIGKTLVGRHRFFSLKIMKLNLEYAYSKGDNFFRGFPRRVTNITTTTTTKKFDDKDPEYIK